MKPEGVFGHKSLESSTPSLSESLDEMSLISVNSATISRSEFISKTVSPFSSLIISPVL